MKCTRGQQGLVVYFVIYVLSVASGQSVIGPSNTVALVGTTVTLHCSVTPSAIAFTWIYNGAVICSGGVCVPPYNYSSSSTSSDLTVPCSLSVAGVYQCSQLGFPAQSSQLIVLASDPVCTPASSSDLHNITLSQSEVMSCSISYNATPNTYSPSMTWTGTPPINSINFNSSSVVNSTLTVVATSANIPYVLPYTCTTQIISLSTPPLNFATNIPTYSYSYTSSQLLVLYPPFSNNISITGSDILLEGQLGQAAINSTLDCSAVGYQGAKFSYIWTNPNGTNTTGPIISLSYLGSNLTYRCTATNAIGSGSNYIIVTVNTTSSTSTSSTTTLNITTTQSFSIESDTSTSSGTPAGLISDQLGLIIGLCVGIPLVIAGVILLCCFYRRCPYYHKASWFTGKSSNNDVKIIYEDIQIPRELDQPGSENSSCTNRKPTSNTETNRFYENSSAENRLHQNVSTSQYEELIRELPSPSNTETNRVYENSSVEHPAHQDVSTSQYQELIRVADTNDSGIQQDAEHAYQDLIHPNLN